MKVGIRHSTSVSALLGGILLVAAGILWPLAGTTPWTEQQAQEFAEASAAQIAAHEHPADSKHSHSDSFAEHQARQQRFEKIKAELESARERPAAVGYWLKLAGGTLCALGILSLFSWRVSN